MIESARDPHCPKVSHISFQLYTVQINTFKHLCMGSSCIICNHYTTIVYFYQHASSTYPAYTLSSACALRKDDFACSSLNTSFVHPPGVSSECYCEQGFTSEGLRVQELQTHARNQVPLPWRLQTQNVAGYQGLVCRSGLLPGICAGKRPPSGTTWN